MNVNGARVLPHNVDAEASVLGGIILRNEVLSRLEALETEDFYLFQHKVVFEATRNLEAAGKPIDVVTLENEIEKDGKLDAIGGIAFLGTLALHVPTADNVLAYTEIVRAHSYARQRALLLAEHARRAADPDGEVDELDADLDRKLGELRSRFADVLAPGVGAGSAARWTRPLDTLLGDHEPDDDDSDDWIIRDIVPRGEPCLLAGPPKAGKTWAGLDIAIAVALGQDWFGGAAENTLHSPARVLVLALEDAERRIRKRLWELCRGRNLTPNDARLRANLSISRIPVKLPSDELRRFALEVKAWRPALVVVDNLTRVMVGDPNSTRDAAAFTTAWAGLCLDVGAAVLMLHHTRKPASDGDRDRDPFDSIRGSGDLLAAARHALVLRPVAAASDDPRLLAELRGRGNLDLRTAGRVVELVREQRHGRMVACLVDRGDPDQLRATLAEERRAAAAVAKRRSVAEALEKRRGTALELCRLDGHVSGRSLALATGASVRTCDATLADLATSGVLQRAGQRGYVLADPDPEAP